MVENRSRERFPESLLDEIRAAVSITEVVGQYVAWDKSKSNERAGDLWACCPFHTEASPSFHADARRGTYHCFGCGASGDHFQFLIESQGLEFVEAVERVAEIGGIPLPDRERPVTQAKPEPEEPAAAPKGRWTLVSTYPYHDRDGELIYETCRVQWKLPDGSFVPGKKGTPKKTFVQRRPSRIGDGSWLWGLSPGRFMRRAGGRDWKQFNQDEFDEWGTGAEWRDFPSTVDHSLYHWPQVEIAIADGRTIFLPEGEKKADLLVAWGLDATCNSGGAANWRPDHAAVFAGADVVILVDNDPAGRERGEKIATSLRGLARRVRVLDLGAAEKRMQDGWDVVNWADSLGGTKEQLEAIVAILPNWRPKEPPSKFGARKFGHVGGTAYDWLIKGLIERAGVFVLAGEMQAGKSFMAIDMGMKIAVGDDYCHRKVKQGLVIYAACEDAKGVELRLEGYRREHNLDAGAVPFLVMTKKLSLLDDKDVDAFIEECLAWEAFYGIKLELIVIDTFSVATEGLDEINSSEVGKVLGRVNRIVDKTAAAVGLVHHLNARGERVRGHSSLTANVSQVIELRPLAQPQPNRNLPPKFIHDDDNRLILKATLVKNKNGPNQESWRFVKRQIKLGEDPDGYPITTCVLVPPNGGSSPTEETGRLTADQKLALKALEEAIEDRGQPMPPGVRVGPQVKLCAPYEAWLDRLRKVWTFKATEDGDREKELRDVVARVGKALITGEYMGRDNDRKIVWSLGKADRPKRPQPKPEEARPEPSAGMQEAIDAGVPF